MMKATLFIGVGGLLLRGGSPRLGALGLGRGTPVTATCMVVAGLSMVGVPPVGGFFSKWYLLEGALEAGQPVLALVILVGSLLALVYMYRLTEAVWFAGPSPGGSPAEAPAAVLVILIVLAGAMVAAGLGNAAIVAGLLEPAAAGALR
jgi:multicomponent Na+:H+ antiporter subunit D